MTLEEYIRIQEMMRTPTGVLPGLSGRVDPNYLGNVGTGRPSMTRPVGMTDAEVDYWSRYGGGLNFDPRQVASQVSRGVAPMPRAGSQGYADVADWRRTMDMAQAHASDQARQDRFRDPMGLPSGYGQEEGGMESYLSQRPSGTFARGGVEHDPRVGGPWDFSRGMPMGWLRYGTGGTYPDPVSAGHVGGGGEGPTRPVEAEEGPAAGSRFSASALSKAAEMIAAAGGDTGGTEAKVGGSTRPYPKQLMAGPMGIATFAPTDLRGNRKREDELYG